MVMNLKCRSAWHSFRLGYRIYAVPFFDNNGYFYNFTTTVDILSVASISSISRMLSNMLLLLLAFLNSSIQINGQQIFSTTVPTAAPSTSGVANITVLTSCLGACA